MTLAPQKQAPRKSVLDRVIGVVSGIIGPTLGLLGAAGMVLGLLALCAFSGWLAETDGTYQLLYTDGDAFFYFLPIVLGLTAAEKLGFDRFIGLALGMSLCYPTVAQLSGGAALGTVLAGILGKILPFLCKKLPAPTPCTSLSSPSSRCSLKASPLHEPRGLSLPVQLIKVSDIV